MDSGHIRENGLIFVCLFHISETEDRQLAPRSRSKECDRQGMGSVLSPAPKATEAEPKTKVTSKAD